MSLPVTDGRSVPELLAECPEAWLSVVGAMMGADLVTLAASYVGDKRRGSVRPSVASLFPGYLDRGGVPATWEVCYPPLGRLLGAPERGRAVHGTIPEAR